MDKIEVNKLDTSIQVGKVKIYLPDQNSKGFYIFQDLAEVLGTETNYDASIKLSKWIKDSKKLSIDSESDFVSIRTKKSELILNVALLINKNYLEVLDDNVILRYHEFLKNWRPPKKQRWGIGDIFSIPLSDNTSYFGQIVSKIEDLNPICIIFKLNKSCIPEPDEFYSTDILGALSFIPDRLSNFTFKVIYNLPVFRQVNTNIRRNPILMDTYSSISIVNLCEELKIKGGTFKYGDILENKNYLT